MSDNQTFKISTGSFMDYMRGVSWSDTYLRVHMKDGSQYDGEPHIQCIGWVASWMFNTLGGHILTSSQNDVEWIQFYYDTSFEENHSPRIVVDRYDNYTGVCP